MTWTFSSAAVAAWWRPYCGVVAPRFSLGPPRRADAAFGDAALRGS